MSRSPQGSTCQFYFPTRQEVLENAGILEFLCFVETREKGKKAENESETWLNDFFLNKNFSDIAEVYG